MNFKLHIDIKRDQLYALKQFLQMFAVLHWWVALGAGGRDLAFLWRSVVLYKGLSSSDVIADF